MEYPLIVWLWLTAVFKACWDNLSRSTAKLDHLDLGSSLMSKDIRCFCMPLLTLAYFHSSHCNARTLTPSPLGTLHLISHTPSPAHTHTHTQTFRTAINKVNLHCKLADGFGICIAACCLLPLTPLPHHQMMPHTPRPPCPVPRNRHRPVAWYCCLPLLLPVIVYVRELQIPLMLGQWSDWHPHVPSTFHRLSPSPTLYPSLVVRLQTFWQFDKHFAACCRYKGTSQLDKRRWFD